MDDAVSLAAISLAATVVGGLIWLLKYGAQTLSKDLQEHTAAAVRQRETSEEVLRFMRNLNGRLESVVAEKLKK